MSQEQQYTIRLKVEGGQVVAAELGQLGATGAGAFQKLQTEANATTLAFGNLGRSIVSGLLPYFGPVALVAGIKSVVTGLSELKDTAQRTGTTTDKLQELRFAAVQVGESATLMDDALFEFNRKLGEAQNGLGRFLPILNKYNIQLKDSNGNNRSASDVLRDYINAIQNAHTQQERLFLSVKAFGEGPGEKLIEVFEKGTNGLDGWAKKAHEAGLVIDKELIATADEFEKDWVKALYNVSIHTEAWAIQLLDILDKIRTTWASGHIFPTADGFPIGPGLPIRQINQKGDPLDFIHAQAAQRRADSMLPAAIPISLLPPAIPYRPRASAPVSSGSSRDPAAELKQQIEDLKFRNEQMMRSNDEQELYNQLRQAGVDIDSKQGQQIKALVEQYNEEKKAAEQFNKALQGGTEETKRQAEAARELGMTFESAFENAIVGGKGLNSVLQGLEQDILRIITRQAITEPMGSLFSGIASGLGSMFSGFFGGGRAGGGGVDEGMSYIVGEEGPEILRMGRNSGHITPNRALSSGGAPGPTMVKVEIIDQVGVKVEARATSDGQGLRIFLKNAVKGMLAGGDLDREMRGRYGISTSTISRAT